MVSYLSAQRSLCVCGEAYVLWDPDEATLMLTTHFLPGRSGVKGEVNCVF